MPFAAAFPPPCKPRAAAIPLAVPVPNRFPPASDVRRQARGNGAVILRLPEACAGQAVRRGREPGDWLGGPLRASACLHVADSWTGGRKLRFRDMEVRMVRIGQRLPKKEGGHSAGYGFAVQHTLIIAAAGKMSSVDLLFMEPRKSPPRRVAKAGGTVC